MSRLSPPSRSRLRRLIVVVLTGLGPMVVPAGVDPAGAASYPLYSSYPQGGTVGTPPMLTKDPDHPHRTLCYKSPCTAEHANYAEDVRALALHGNRLVLGGVFHGLVDGDRKSITPKTPFLAEVNASTGKVASDQTFARNAAPNGTVEAIVVSPERKRVYVAGRFSRIGGGAASRVAALDIKTGLLDRSFRPPAPDAGVRTMVLGGGRIFIGGEFLKVGSMKFPSVAALNADDGSLVSGWKPPANYGGSFIEKAATETESRQGVVDTLAVAGGGRILMVGGTFEHFGRPRSVDPKANRYGGLIALNTSDGRLSSWAPYNSRPAIRIAMSPDGNTAYVVEGGSGGWIGAFKPGGTEKPVWIGRVDGDVLAVTATDKRVYVGGHFDAEVPNHNDPCLQKIPTICIKSGTHHRHLVAFDLRGKSDPKWTAQADTAEGPTVMLAGPKALYVGGTFKNILPKSRLDGGKGIPHPGFAMFPG
jgi:hypothetical protein